MRKVIFKIYRNYTEPHEIAIFEHVKRSDTDGLKWFLNIMYQGDRSIKWRDYSWNSYLLLPKLIILSSLPQCLRENVCINSTPTFILCHVWQSIYWRYPGTSDILGAEWQCKIISCIQSLLDTHNNKSYKTWIIYMHCKSLYAMGDRIWKAFAMFFFIYCFMFPAMNVHYLYNKKSY